MSSTLRRLAGSASAAVLLTGVVGCGSGGSSDPVGSSSSLSPQATASPSATASTAATNTPSEAPSAEVSAPAGTTLVTGQRSRMRFAVPSSWQVTEVSKVLDAGDDAALEDLAQQMNLSLAQVKAAARTIDVAAFGPAVDGFAPNVNVQTLPVEELPSAAQLKLAMSSVGGTVESVDDVSTALGPGRLSRYRLELGATKVVGRQLGLKAPGGVVLVTVSHVDAKQADVVLAMIRSSLAAS